MLKLVNKHVDLNQDQESKLLKIINKTNKDKIKKNLQYIVKLGASEKNIALLLANHPEIFLLEPNEENNASISAKTKFFAQYGIEPKYGAILYPELLTLETYDNSNEVKVLSYLENDLNIAKKDIGKMLRKYHRFLKFPINDKSVNGVKSKLEFWKKLSEVAEVDFNKFITRHPQFLASSIDPKDPNSVVSKIEYLKNRFGVTYKDIADQIYKFPNFMGLDIDPSNPANIDKKALRLNELGFSDQIIGKNLKSLGAPFKKLKIRYMICKNFGMSDSMFLNNKFMIHEVKLYARACYLRDKKNKSSLLYATDPKFKSCTGISLSELIKLYPLTTEEVKKQEELFNKSAKTPIKLSEAELNAINHEKYLESLERGV